MYNNSSKWIAAMILRDKEQVIVYGGIISIILLSWWYLIDSHYEMYVRSDMSMWMPPANNIGWHPNDFFMLFLMWSIMMAAMMLPTIFPLLTVHASLLKNKNHNLMLLNNMLLLGYVLAWIGFSAFVVFVQWPLHYLSVLSPMMEPYYSAFTGAMLIFAGLYQWSHFKTVCLNRCRAPLGFLIQHWSVRPINTFFIGLRYGAFCIGCCWVLMLLMIALGMMNVLWIVLLTLFILLEKLFPFASIIRIFSGLLFVGWGVFWLIA